ncbi:MAG TPA: type II toxin-antitoxin system prevent-host-death family antitoxin [Casimicrobiaceae bacterium]|nr:type II toxin-antitoxin system prevent-host-death family antitoxin [Casimicrobiaceae bacterium]
MYTRIGAYEAKTKLPELLRRVEAGEQFIITNRGEPVAELRPVTRETHATVREAIARMRALPKVRGVSAKTVRELIEEGRR